MAHNKHALHISHYPNSPTWRSTVAPEDRSWILLIDVNGSPHLYLAAEAQDAEGQTVTTYAPCVRAMLRDGAPVTDDATAWMTIEIRSAAAFNTDPLAKYQAANATHTALGATPQEAVVSLFDYMSRTAEPIGEGVAVLTL